MDRETIIRVQTALLLEVVAEMFAMLPAGGDALVRRVHLAVLAMLRPAEASARRVIAIAATLVTLRPLPQRQSMPKGGIPAGSGTQSPSFPLFDPRKSVEPKKKKKSGRGPGAWSFGDTREPSSPTPAPVMPDDIVDGTCLLRRMAALLVALEDVPKQARRLARQLAGGRARYLRVMRPGRPPGHRARGKRAIDAILADCQSLALAVLHEVEIADSS